MTRWAEHLSTHGQDPRSIAQQAVETALRAYAMNPNNAFPHDQIGLAYQLIANYENDHGLDTAESEKKAIEAFSKSIEINRNFAWALNDYGVLLSTKADWLGARPGLPDSELEQAIEKLNAAIEADQDYAVAYSNLAHAHQQMATWRSSTASHQIYGSAKPSTPARARCGQPQPLSDLSQPGVGVRAARQVRAELRPVSPGSEALSKAHEALNQAIKANPTTPRLTASWPASTRWTPKRSSR